MSEKYFVDWTSRFKKDYKRAIMRGKDKRACHDGRHHKMPDSAITP